MHSFVILQQKSEPCRLSYSAELSVGPQILRPFHLAWRADFGLSALIEPETVIELAELILLNGLLVNLQDQGSNVLCRFGSAFHLLVLGIFRFRTDAGTMQGVEKLSVTSPDSAFLKGSYTALGPLPDSCPGLSGGLRGFWGSGFPRSSSCFYFWLGTGDTLPPFSVAYVKGWRRSVTCLIVAEAIRELRLDFADLTQNYKVTSRPSLQCNVSI